MSGGHLKNPLGERSSRPILLAFLLACVMPPASPVFADPQSFLKESERALRAGDTQTALRQLKACVVDPSAAPWMIEESLKSFTSIFRAPSDSPSALFLFSQALQGDEPRAGSAVSSLVGLLMDYPALSGEEKIFILSTVKSEGTAGDEILNARIQLLRRLGRHDPAVELAAALAQHTGRLDHRVQVVDLLLDLSRSADALALGNSILNDVAPDPSAYSMLAERFYRHGDYRNALAIHRRARQTFSNPALFFDQSLSICQGLQLGREGIELYLPLLLESAAPAPEFYRDFIALTLDTALLTLEYPAWIGRGQNPNLFLVALFRFADIASDSACLHFVRQYRDKFGSGAGHRAHIEMAELLLERRRRPAFLLMLSDLPDTPADLVETKRFLMFKQVLRTDGPDRALQEFGPESFSTKGMRASVYRQFAAVFSDKFRFHDAIGALKSAQEIAAEPADHLRLARLYFLVDMDSAALASAHHAHRLTPSDETLYWLGWLSYLGQDTQTARKAFRDVILRPEVFLADESLTWLIAMRAAFAPGSASPQDIGRSMRSAMQGRQESVDEGRYPTVVQMALRREAIRAGADGKSLSAGVSPFLQYIRWESLPKKDRSEKEYQNLLKNAPEHLRSLIRIEEP